MAHSIELIFDEVTNTIIGEQWRKLADAGLPSQGSIRSTSNRPHVTLIAADSIDATADMELSAIRGVAGMTVNIGALLLFWGRRGTAARLVVPSDHLLDIHAQVFDATCPHIGGRPLAHVSPGSWTPHITLARRLVEGHLGHLMRALSEGPEMFTAQVAGLRRWNGDTREEFQLV
ncbi:UNVERIFIED_CONTAM: 2'-5' RNA ligase superfamily protein [Williamsia faeni]